MQCGELCHWRTVVQSVGCSGPWMPDIDVSYCDDANRTKQLIKLYRQLEDLDGTQCGCYQPCTTTIFTASVMNRKRFQINIPAAQIWVYYTSKMVSVRFPILNSLLCAYNTTSNNQSIHPSNDSSIPQVVEEFHGYDFNQFVSDLGGSLGFLLGLSVLGLIGLLEKIVELVFIRRLIAEKRKKQIGEDTVSKDPMAANNEETTKSPITSNVTKCQAIGGPIVEVTVK